MSPETLTIIAIVVGVGIGLAGLLMHLVGRFTRLENWQIAQGERLARLEGKLDRFESNTTRPALMAKGPQG